MGNNVKASGLRSCKATLTTMMMAIVLLLGRQASAFSVTTSNISNLASHCSASTTEECLVDIGHADHVFFAEPETSLQKAPPKFTEFSKKNFETPDDKCGRKFQTYNPCVPDPNDSKKAEHCTGIYKNQNRGCK